MSIGVTLTYTQLINQLINQERTGLISDKFSINSSLVGLHKEC